jgi:hypothetical protein
MNMLDDVKTEKKASPLLITIGFTFVILGGILGSVIGLSLINKKYDKRSRTIGWIMFGCGLITTNIYRVLYSANYM